MDRNGIMEVLPHRGPMLLLDTMELDAEGVCHATYTIPENPFFCDGHFPGNPIVPGVILCEIMAQACSQLFVEVFAENLVMYRGLDAVKFRGTVRPGDLCEVSARLIETKGTLYVCDATLSVSGRRCAQARITLAAVPKD
ncbi:MAG: beta-hydroxyacyl-ACP dehydratase [Bacteroidales bacterium]|nr:beta-hydroxyacyl-ACP dehydratase [Bacteroidales bacterium]